MNKRMISGQAALPQDTTTGDGPSRWHVLLATWLGEMFDGMDASIFILVLFPALSEILNTKSHSVVGVHGSYILATFMVGWAIGGIVFGTLADHIGRARTLVYTILLYAICTGLCGLSHSWQEMAFYRFLVGCGIGGEISIGGVLMAECWSGKSRLHATGAMCTSFGFGYIIAALLNLFIGGLGWRWLFLAGVVPAILTAYIRAKLKEPVQFELTREYKKRLRAKPESELSEEEAAVLRPTLMQIFSRKNRPRTLLSICLASTAIVGYWAVLSWIPPWINQLTGTTAIQERSFAAFALNIGAICSALLAGSMVIYLGRRVSFTLCYIGALLCCLGMFLTTKTFGIPFVAWCFAVGFFAVAIFSLLFIFVPESFDTKLRATAMGFCIQVGRLVAAVAALTGGQLISLFGGSYAMAGATVALFYVVGIIASMFVKAPAEDLLRKQSNYEAEALPVNSSPS